MTLSLGFSFELDVTTRSEWSNIELLRGSVQRCFIAVFENLDGCHAIAMVSEELLENAVKYGAWNEAAAGMLHLRAWGEEHRAFVRVSNPCRRSDHAEVLLALRWISGFETPAEAYQARLQEIAREPRGTGISKLGLIRISYEGSCKLTAEYDGEILTMTGEIAL